MKDPSVVPALSPSNCCIWRSSCDGFRSPSSYALNSCCSCQLLRGGSPLDQLFPKGVRRMVFLPVALNQVTDSMANSGEKEGNNVIEFIFCDEMPHVTNCA